jgi:hypothetical protein
MQKLTLELKVSTEGTEVDGGHRNRRWKTTSGARNPRNSGRNRAPRFDSLCQVVEDDDALRLEVASLLGVAGDEGAPRNLTVVLSVGGKNFSRSLAEKEKGEARGTWSRRKRKEGEDHAGEVEVQVAAGCGVREDSDGGGTRAPRACGDDDNRVEKGIPLRPGKWTTSVCWAAPGWGLVQGVSG